MNVHKSVKCPYCGAANNIVITSDRGSRDIILCDPMYGGCDKYFVAKSTVNIEVKCLKIEGENER